jgi:acyl-CoA thioesterase I
MPSNRSTRSLAALLALLALGACSEHGPRLTSLPQDAVIVAFGDSLTYGTGATPQESYPAQLAELVQREVVNAGVPGELSGEGVRRLAAVLNEHQPRLLLLCHGGNDLLRRKDDRQLAENLREMVRQARQRGIDVVLIAVPQPGLWLSPSALYRSLADELGIPLEQDTLSKVLSRRELKSDTIHPNAAGYTVLAEALARGLRQAGAIE